MKKRKPAGPPPTAAATARRFAKSLLDLPQGEHPDQANMHSRKHETFPTLQAFCEATNATEDAYRKAVEAMTRDQWIQYCNRYAGSAIQKLQLSAKHLDSFYDQLKGDQTNEQELDSEV